MPNEPNEETQYTPKGEEIPIPDRQDVFRDLEKVAKSRRRDGQSDPPTSEDLD
jgi:hypothetical protein